MACAIDVAAEQAQPTAPTTMVTLSQLQDWLDALENQGVDSEILEHVADVQLRRLRQRG